MEETFSVLSITVVRSEKLVTAAEESSETQRKMKVRR
jgi:hypothetical protein